MARRYQRPGFFERISWDGVALAAARHYRLLMFAVPLGVGLTLVGAAEISKASKAGPTPTLDLEGYLIERAKNPELGLVKLDGIVCDYTGLRFTKSSEGYVDRYYIPVKRAAAVDEDVTELVLRNSSRSLFRYFKEVGALRTKGAVENYRRSRLTAMRKPGVLFVEAVGTLRPRDFDETLLTARDRLAPELIVIEQRDPGGPSAVAGLLALAFGLLFLGCIGAALLSGGDGGARRARKPLVKRRGAERKVKPKAERALGLNLRSPAEAARERLAAVRDPRIRPWKARPGARTRRVGVEHKSIQEAIDAAGPGDRILIPAGEYTESLKLNKDVELVGEGEVAVLASKSYALESTAACARVSNLRFVNELGRFYCVLVTEGCLNADGCRVSSLGAGIGASGEGGLVLHACELEDIQGAAVYMQGSSALLAYNNTLNIPKGCSGFYLAGRGASFVLANRIEGRGHGLHAEEAVGAVLVGNTVAVKACHGAELSRCSEVLLADNVFRGGEEAAIHVLDSAAVAIEGNRVVGSGFGMELYRCSEIRVEGNVVGEARESGVFLQDCSAALVSENSVDGCGRCGLYLERCEDAELRGNESLNHEVDGVVVEACAAALIANRIEGNAGVGVAGLKSATIRFRDNRIAGNDRPRSLAKGSRIIE